MNDETIRNNVVEILKKDEIQNIEGLYEVEEEVKEMRQERQEEFKEKYSNKKRSVDEMPNSQLMYDD